MTDLDEIERVITRRLDALLKTPVAASERDREWTVAVKKTLGDLGKELGYDVCASDPKGRFEQEWLFDLIWFRLDHDENLKDLSLIMEMEWAMSFDEIKWDFEKLMVGRAGHRVLIFQAANSHTIDDYCRRLIRDITSFVHSAQGDRYLIAAYDQKTALFVYRRFQY